MCHLRADEARIPSGLLIWALKRMRPAAFCNLADALRHPTCSVSRSSLRRQANYDAFR